ncbi:glutaminase A [Salimicrobium halophilum]|uniref:Glutaminase n=1 Tax=Salimicrobium halophilum TaxID=86666 RepID=A0A1G8WPJ4_9BACI|nr:glutaminase A [Salimicrobium halophilum]SDJ80111.1 L-glutaminase [Salimicrobium halophilum]
MKQLSEKLLEELVEDSLPYASEGKVRPVIPYYDETKKDILGVTIWTGDHCYHAGEQGMYVPMQSTAKIVTLMLALNDFGKDRVFEMVGMEPMGDFFNSISQLEKHNIDKPFNPMVNAGAIATSALIKGGNVEERFERYMDFMKKITGNPDLVMSEDVYKAEQANGARNRSLAYFMQSTGAMIMDPEEALDFYFRTNAVMMCTDDFARVGYFLANGGREPETNKRLIPPDHLRTVKSIMLTSGMYNSSGQFAVEAGFPLKSGVSGTIIGAVPGRMGIGIVAPAIDNKGNSTAGGALVKSLSQALNLNMFGVTDSEL